MVPAQHVEGRREATAVVVIAMIVAMTYVPTAVEGHGFCIEPISRQYLRSKEFND
ncbi:unnamed protein product, partial [Ectocarpus sp. 12 AP-2014]